MKCDATVANHLDRRLREFAHVTEPLKRDQRLHPATRALGVRHVVHVGLRARDEAFGPQRGHHRCPGLFGLHPAEGLGGGVGYAAVFADHRYLLEPVGTPDVEVRGVVPGRDLQRAGSELGVHVLVGDDLEAAADQRKSRRLTDQPRVALVGRVNGDGGVGEHGLRPHRGHRDRTGAGLERVVHEVERVLDRPLLDLQVRDRGPQAGVPVDHVVVAVDQLLLEQADEHVQHRPHVVVVHREALVVVVERGAQALVLVGDLRPVQAPPFPHPRNEALAAELLLGQPLFRQRVLHLALRRYTGVVSSVDPFRAPAAHPRQADAEILDRAVEGMAHVQRSGDVRRRHSDRVVVGRGALGLGVEDPRRLPAGEHRRLHLGGVVTGPLLEPPQPVAGHGIKSASRPAAVEARVSPEAQPVATSSDWGLPPSPPPRSPGGGEPDENPASAGHRHKPPPSCDRVARRPAAGGWERLPAAAAGVAVAGVAPLPAPRSCACVGCSS